MSTQLNQGGQKLIRAICNFSLECITHAVLAQLHVLITFYIYKSSSFYTAHCSVLMV